MDTDVVGVNETGDLHKMPLDRRKSVSTIGDGEQGDTCRICRGEGTIIQPLFYPCKCSGSIKFVHQDCLMEWLSHSQKKYCELCKTPFRFTKLYHPSMPTTLPMPLFLRQVSVHAFRSLGRWLRYVFVTFIWTCWLPWSIRQIWRGLFWLADGSWISAQEIKQLSAAELARAIVNATSTNITAPQITDPSSPQTPTASYFDPVGELFNLLTGAPLLRGLLRLLAPKAVSAPVQNSGTYVTEHGSAPLPPLVRQPSLLSNVSSLNTLTKYPVVNNGLVDVLEGQLICLSVIAAFILVFLIREWVINQQPILNMPNPEQADAQPVPAQPNDEARPAGRRRRRGFRRVPDRDGQLENRVMDPIQRPMVVARPRRAATDENITTAQPSDDVLQRPEIPVRSTSLIANSEATERIFTMDLDGQNLRSFEDSPNFEDLEAPPLQRGIFDDVVDIRRNIEERVIPLPEIDNNSSITQSTDYSRHDSNLSFTPPYLMAGNDSTDRVHRTDFGLEQRSQTGINQSTENNLDIRRFALSPEANRTEVNDENEAEDTALADSDSPWESLELSQSSETTSSDPNTVPTNDSGLPEPAPDTTEEQQQERRTNDENIPSGTDDDELPETFLGRLAQWMWHTEEHTRAPNLVLGQGNNNGADRANVAGNIFLADNANIANPAPIPANDPAHEPNIQFGIDLNDPNALDDAEDLEGILELIGMEGPLVGMIQNIIFSVFLITLTLAASVWCPYIWGKIAILILSNPIGVFIKAPLFFVSKCGNILVDILLFFGGLVGYGLSNVTKVVRIFVGVILPGVAAHIKVSTVENWAYGISQNSGIRLEKALTGTFFGLRPDLPTFSTQSHHALRVFKRAFVDASAAIAADLGDTVKNATGSWHSHGILGLPVFIFNEVVNLPTAAFSAVRKTGEWLYVLSQDLRMRPLSEMSEHGMASVVWTTEDKVLAILVGYAFFAAAGFAYLKIAHAVLGLAKGEKVDGMFADSLRQAGGVLKVIVIIGIEMIAFPLYCGLLLDCALLPLFQNATFQSRFGFLMAAPVTCLFIHWFVGTCYMFHFALFVSMCRKIMRKGVLYFIRDPDDPTFHPVRDVLERPVATQLGKIAFSACVYGGLVIVCLGGVVWSVSSIGSVLPVQWATSEPRLAFPVDIIFYNFMLPFILRRAEPSKKISAMYEWWFRQCARNLRLSHFLFGDEREDEKFESQPFWRRQPSSETAVSETMHDGEENAQSSSFESRKRNGRYVRGPAADSVRIPKGTRVFIEVNENNERTDGEADHDKGMHGKEDERFTKIYLPPHFRVRISIFVFLVWLYAASVGLGLTVLPLLVGRWIIRRASGLKSAPNDLYAFTVGVHVCGVVAFAIYMGFTRQRKLQTKVSNLLTNTKESLPRLYQVTKHILGLVYVYVAIFIVLPLTTSLLTELYIHMPIYSYFASSFQTTQPTKSAGLSSTSISINPTIFILQTWTLGLLYLRIALRLLLSYPEGQNRPSTALRAIGRNGYLHPDVALASRALIFPALTICIVLLAAPLGLARMIIIATKTTPPHEQLQIYRYSYPVLFGMAVSAYIAVGIQNKIEGWRVKVRDEVYLVGERLHNFSEPESEKKKKAENAKGKGKAIDNSIGDDAESSRIDTSAQIVGHSFGTEENAVTSGSSTT